MNEAIRAQTTAGMRGWQEETVTQATTAVEFDPFSMEFYNGAQDIYARLRAEAPDYYNEQYDFYALSRHADVAPAYRDYETFSSAKGVDLSAVRTGQDAAFKSIITLDPPEHRYMRSLVSKVFTPRAIAGLREMVTDRIGFYLNQNKGKAEFDLIQDFSALFPIDIVSRMLGVPEDERTQVRVWTDELLYRDVGQVELDERGIKAVIAITRYYHALAKKRRDEPQDDMISRLIEARVERTDDQPPSLSNIEIAMFGALLGGAGAETVAKLIGGAGVIFSEHQDQWQELYNDRSKIGDAVEELLRISSPNQYNVRYLTKEIELHGVTIPAGKPIFLLIGSANLDPEAWTDPDVFNINRNLREAPNLAFGYGLHSCLGAALARIESSIALDMMLDFMPRFEVDRANCKRVTMQNVAGWNNVPTRVLA